MVPFFSKMPKKARSKKEDPLQALFAPPFSLAFIWSSNWITIGMIDRDKNYR
jgi:hypothetical protein